ncbi:MAG: heavy-metal-associated domain-containing protein [Gammaproteobacteria bacterium]|nr:heavy-metal-associated domain-containing protein [Gammaproteobacteria bacterium]MCK5263129.1 heavy-metal-associated domain-containing protein [Gammaproteobacteria bacterium]
MNYEFNVENIKCGGCAGTIVKKLNAIDGVENTDVDIEAGIVKVSGNDGLHENLLSSLLKMGYPETGSTEGMAAAKAKAKSFVSCAVGKFNTDK